ncbi:unnamed protein product [Camellia sinensis]
MGEVDMPRVKLGRVSKLGYGCMGLTGIYNSPVSEEDGIAIIKYAYSRGITFFDTSDIYGVDHANEILVGKALKQLPWGKIELATKFGIAKIEPTQVVVKGTPKYVRSRCEASLRHLGVDYIDLYYVHRIDTLVPIEETGEPGIGIVPYAPTARRFFGGKAAVESVPANSFLGIACESEAHEDGLKEISDAVRVNEVAGVRIYGSLINVSYKFSDTPLPKDAK